MKRRLVLLAAVAWLVLLFATLPFGAQADPMAETVERVLERLSREVSAEELASLTLDRVTAALTDEERLTLSTGHLRFSVDAPIVVTVLHDKALGRDPFWLAESGFEPQPPEAVADGDAYDVWQKAFPAGVVALGANSLAGGGNHYFVALTPQVAGGQVRVTDLQPAESLALGTLREGERVYTDDDARLESIPPELEGQTLIRTAKALRDSGKLLGVLRVTPYPSSKQPDHALLTWAGDPRTSLSIQWRTSSEQPRGAVAFVAKAEYETFHPAQPEVVWAETVPLEDKWLVNDRTCHWHTARLTGLKPDTTYLYALGNGTAEGWGQLSEFRTAPAKPVPFRFIYLGDAQYGMDRVGVLVDRAYRENPDAAFTLMAGDLITRGADRANWDDLLHHVQGACARRPVVPAAGNHEYSGGNGQPGLYLRFFDLPTDGPAGIAERAYSFEYGNALFVVLDGNLPPESQAAWLDQRLGRSSAAWKFVMVHQPMYSSEPKRDNKELRETWVPIFDKHHVDLVFQGHDHAYLRTYPLRNSQRVASPAEGTIYLISVAGTKMYQQAERDYTEVGFTNTQVYSVIDILPGSERTAGSLRCQTYDLDGRLRDEFTIEK